MLLQEVKEQAFKLSVNDRLVLVNLIVESLQKELNHQMRGFLKTDKPVITDMEVQAMLEERLLEKYS